MILSIIVPVYNAERFIDRCVTSIYNDAPNDDIFEVIVINDGSKDKSAMMLEKYCDKHRNMTMIDKINEGVSVARNLGIKKAKGDSVLFLDADDELVEGSLMRVCEFLAANEPIDMLVTRQIRNNGQQEKIVGEPPLEEYRRYDGVEAFKKGFVRTNAGGGICRRDFLKNNKLFFPEGVRNAEDTIFFGHLQVFADSIVYYNLPMYRIREAEGSACRSRDYTNLGKSHLVTMRAVVHVKKTLNASREKKAIFDYVAYQLMANTIGKFVQSKDLDYRLLKKEVDIKNILPLDTENMYKMKRNARFMNFSLLLFYFFSWLKYNCSIVKFCQM